MSREIKFRVWDNKDNKFFKPVYAAYKGELLDLSITLRGELIRRTLEQPCEHESCFKGRYSIQQFTGLKDKNGVDIYEGDILKITLYDDEWKTKVRDYYGTLIIDVEGCDWNTTALSFLDDEAETEVIGNIYENPELLK